MYSYAYSDCRKLDSEKNLTKCQRGKKQNPNQKNLTYSGKRIRIRSNFSSETKQARRVG
jgi:hypothetical protein